jgi:hypothetical protein
MSTTIKGIAGNIVQQNAIKNVKKLSPVFIAV